MQRKQFKSFEDIIMKKSFIVLFLMSFLIINDVSARRQIDIHQNGQMPSRSETLAQTEPPCFYYDSKTQEVIIEGNGYVAYYEVEMISLTTLQLVFYGTISSFGSTIDISYLPKDNYAIIITSSDNSVYEDFFSHSPSMRYRIVSHGKQ